MRDEFKSGTKVEGSNWLFCLSLCEIKKMKEKLLSLNLIRSSVKRSPYRGTKLKRPLIREDLKVIQYQSQEADNTFIISDGTSPYNSTRKWAVKRHYREDNN